MNRAAPGSGRNAVLDPDAQLPTLPFADQGCLFQTAIPQSLSHVVIHLVFSTKDRFAFLSPELRKPLHSYLATVARKAESECYRVGGVGDHVHLAVRLARTITIAALVEELKTASSKWLKDQGPATRAFSWQRGYGCFSVEPDHIAPLVAYIDGQEAHHRTVSFQEEYRLLLGKYGIPFDERYVWD